SVTTGREIDAVSSEAPGWSSKTGRIRKAPEKVQGKPDPAMLKAAKKAALPPFLPPMLATLAATPPADKRWLHEVKFDGYRLQARIEAGRVKLLTRSGLD